MKYCASHFGALPHCNSCELPEPECTCTIDDLFAVWACPVCGFALCECRGT